MIHYDLRLEVQAHSLPVALILPAINAFTE